MVYVYIERERDSEEERDLMCVAHAVQHTQQHMTYGKWHMAHDTKAYETEPITHTGFQTGSIYIYIYVYIYREREREL